MAPFSLTNRFIAPTFENGVNGWTATGASGAPATLSVSTAYSLHGTQCLKLSVPAGSGAVRLIPPSFPIIEDPYRLFALTFSAASTTGGVVYYGFERFKPDLTFHNNYVTNMTLTSTMQEVGLRDYLSPDNAAFIGGELPKIYVIQNASAQEFYFDGFTWLDSADQEFYPFQTGSMDLTPQIAGSWADDASYAYSWTGAVEASTSVATHHSELFMPAAFNRGDMIAVTGTGFPASSTVDIIIGEHWNRPPAATAVATDSSGNLSTTVEVPYYHDPGMAYIVGKPAGGVAIGSMMKQEVWTNPSDLSLATTNYFPNPNGQTLGVDGIRPKYFGPSYYEEDVVTRASVDGAYRVRITSAFGATSMDIAESGNAFGLVDGKQYLVRARVQSTATPTNGWAYLQTNDGNSDDTLVGPSPWTVIGLGTGAFGGPLEWINDGWTEGDVVDLDHLSIVEGATYMVSWAGGMPMSPGATIDAYEIGLRPGRTYELSGYTYGTFKVRTGTSEGTLSDLLVWNNVNPDEWTGGAVTRTFTVPEGHGVIQLAASGADKSWILIHDYIPYFDGDTPDDENYTYSWAGTPHDSASIRTPVTSGLAAQVWVSGAAKAVAEMRVVVDGALIPITEAGA